LIGKRISRKGGRCQIKIIEIILTDRHLPLQMDWEVLRYSSISRMESVFFPVKPSFPLPRNLKQGDSDILNPS
jgi:hypothetical protein